MFQQFDSLHEPQSIAYPLPLKTGSNTVLPITGSGYTSFSHQTITQFCEFTKSTKVATNDTCKNASHLQVCHLPLERHYSKNYLSSLFPLCDAHTEKTLADLSCSTSFNTNLSLILFTLTILSTHLSATNAPTPSYFSIPPIQYIFYQSPRKPKTCIFPSCLLHTCHINPSSIQCIHHITSHWIYIPRASLKKASWKFRIYIYIYPRFSTSKIPDKYCLPVLQSIEILKYEINIEWYLNSTEVAQIRILNTCNKSFISKQIHNWLIFYITIKTRS